MCLCHLPVSDVDPLVIGHRQGEGCYVAPAVDVGNVGAHVLQEGDTGRKVMNNGAEYSDSCEGSTILLTIIFSLGHWKICALHNY